MSDLDPNVAKYKLDTDIKFKMRLSAQVDSQLTTAIQKLCGSLPAISKCYLLDIKLPDRPDTDLLILPLLESNLDAEPDSIALHFQEMLRAFPQISRKTFIVFKESLAESFKGHELYKKSG